MAKLNLSIGELKIFLKYKTKQDEKVKKKSNMQDNAKIIQIKACIEKMAGKKVHSDKIYFFLNLCKITKNYINRSMQEMQRATEK